jgi:Uma2 family endonuclease
MDVWVAMSEAERAAVIECLPAEEESLLPPEGDAHRLAKSGLLDALDGYFRKLGRRVYLSSEINVFYPGEPRFSPDVLAVVDVAPHPRERWVTAQEGRGLDFVLEVFVHGNRRKDHEANVERYARLGIEEYFLFDRGRLRLSAWRLPSRDARRYEPIVPQTGRWASRVLALELSVEAGKLRAWVGSAPVPEAAELAARFEKMVEDVTKSLEERVAEAEARAEEETRLREEETRLREEETRRRAAVETQLAEALAEIERLKRG